MGHTYAVSGLVNKRAEMAGLIEYHQKEIERLRQGLYQVDAAIRLFDPAYRIRSIKTKEYRRYSRIFKKSECYRLCLDALRHAGDALSTTLIAEIIMHKKGLAQEQQATIMDSVNNSLRFAERRGIVQRVGMDGIAIRWKLAD
ncbi:MAG: hypothetical protein KGN39_05595 [Betaproteobacteria bacterium]|nr:hypothetical protein [Betaproteobacteria bacterium]